MAEIENLSKITLSVLAGTTAGSSDLTPVPITVEFVFGLGVSGMTQFEYELSGKRQGDHISLAVKAQDVSRTFEHLAIPLPPLPAQADTYHLKIGIETVRQIPASEIIKSLAQITGCGAGHECDCGCGGTH